MAPRQLATLTWSVAILGMLPLGAMAQPGWMAPPVLPPSSLPPSSLPSLSRPASGQPGTSLSAPPASALATLPRCPLPVETALKLTSSSPYESQLKRSWEAYGDRFIQPQGEVVDYQSKDQRTTSEGQAYAMLRAVLINDQVTFDQTLAWAEVNLDRPSDSLWAWHWTQAGGIQDQNFATDADIDAATALILAARRWKCPAYEALAQQKINDIWRLTVVDLRGKQFILPGPREAFQNRPEQTLLNPSYFAPYAYRLFAQVDKSHNWTGLVNDGYALLEAMTAISPAGLPADWVAFNPKTGQFGPIQGRETLRSVYSFDAYRVWWRLGLDANWYNSAPAKAYLVKHLPALAERWKKDKAIAAELSLDGKAQVEYEATSQYAMLYPVMKLVDRQVAFELFKYKLLGNYSEGIWDNKNAYYSQNLAWFALLPPQGPTELLKPAKP
jgi:endoglucanase